VSFSTPSGKSKDNSSPILYDFNYLIDMDNSFEEPKVPQRDLVEIKFAVIEFLYEFLKEDIERCKETKRIL
jgi:hypothetical protein